MEDTSSAAAFQPRPPEERQYNPADTRRCPRNFGVRQCSTYDVPAFWGGSVFSVIILGLRHASQELFQVYEGQMCTIATDHSG